MECEINEEMKKRWLNGDRIGKWDCSFQFIIAVVDSTRAAQWILKKEN
jgi:hypothetical protein